MKFKNMVLYNCKAVSIEEYLEIFPKFRETGVYQRWAILGYIDMYK